MPYFCRICFSQTVPDDLGALTFDWSCRGTMFTIVRATEHLCDESTCYSGCPIVIRSGVADPVPSAFMMHLWREGYSPDTIGTYAHALARWLNYLAFRRLDWWQADLDDVTKHQRTLQGRCAGSTINIALSTIAKFHSWLRNKGLCSVPTFKIGRAQTRGGNNAHIIRGIRVLEREIRDIREKEMNATLGASKRIAPDICFRDELAAELGYWSGLRRMEIAALELKQIRDAKNEDNFYTVRLTKTKGNKPREVYIPYFLMQRIRRYIDIYRAQVVTRQKLLRRGYREPPSVLLTKHGKPLRREYITQTWKESAKEAGVNLSFHATRHGFGTWFTKEIEEAGLPLRIVSSRMGHADVRTTLRYVHSRTAKTAKLLGGIS